MRMGLIRFTCDGEFVLFSREREQFCSLRYVCALRILCKYFSFFFVEIIFIRFFGFLAFAAILRAIRTIFSPYFLSSAAHGYSIRREIYK